MPAFFAAAYMALGVACVYVSISFINGQLLPTLLHSVYDSIPSALIRTAIVCLTLLFAANFFIAKGYANGGQALGGAFYVLCVVLGMVATAMLVNKTSINLHIVGGLVITSLGALWVVYGLNQTA